MSYLSGSSSESDYESEYSEDNLEDLFALRFSTGSEYNQIVSKLISDAAIYKFLNMFLHLMSDLSLHPRTMRNELQAFQKACKKCFKSGRQRVKFAQGDPCKFYLIDSLFKFPVSNAETIIHSILSFRDGLLDGTDRITPYKRELPYESDFYHMSQNHVCSLKPLAELDGIFRFLFSEDIERVNRYKVQKFLNRGVGDAQVIHWAFLDMFMKKVFENRFEVLISILNWCYGSKEEFNAFKSTLIRHSVLKNVIAGLLEPTFQLVDQFLNWCFEENKDRIKSFKTMFASSFCEDLAWMNSVYVKRSFKSFHENETAKKLVCWLNVNIRVGDDILKMIENKNLGIEDDPNIFPSCSESSESVHYSELSD